jgi:hypothetical protein
MKKLEPFNFEDAENFVASLGAAIEARDIEKIKEVIKSESIIWAEPQPVTERFINLRRKYIQLLISTTDIVFPRKKI